MTGKKKGKQKYLNLIFWCQSKIKDDHRHRNKFNI